MKNLVLAIISITFVFSLNYLYSNPEENFNSKQIIEQDSLVSTGYIVTSVYPNPCMHDELYIKFRLEETEYIKIRIYDFNGNMVKTVIDDIQYSGETDHTINFNAAHLANGAYEYTIQAGKHYKTGKFVVHR